VEGTPGEQRTDTKALADNLTAVLGAVAAAGTLVVVPGAVAMLLRLEVAGLPADLGIVVSLPERFLLAIGLTYVLFPLLVVVGLTLLVVLVPGKPGDPNPALNPDSPDESTDSSERRSARYGWALAGGFVLVSLLGLPFLVDSSPPWWAFGLSAVTALIWLWWSRLAAGRVQASRTVGAGVVALIAVVAVVPFLPWATAFAVARGELPPTTVCRSDGNRLDGFLVGETTDRVYVGEIPNRVVIFGPSNDPALRGMQGALRAASYDVRIEPSPTKVSFGRVGLAIVDLSALDEAEAERLFDDRQSEHVSFLAYESGGPLDDAVPDRDELPRFELETLKDPVQLRDRSEVALKQSSRRERPQLRITSIPASQVSRLLIGSLGPCPTVRE
jgi:hypothetical protein